MSAKVDYILPEVTELKKKWELIQDCLRGSDAVKARRTKYLVKPNETDDSPENEDSYKARLARAVFYAVTGRTHKGLIGQVFAKDPSVELPPTLRPFVNNVDGSGVPLDQQAKRALGLVLAYGRAGLLVDYPTTADGTDARPTTRQDLLEGRMRPTLLLYEPWDIINWRTRAVGSETLLSLVVISETYLKSDDGFEPEYAPQIRVLRLEEGTNTYSVEIWRKGDDGWLPIGPKVQPTDASGKPFNVIPFTFLGSENNEATPDEPPLYDMATLNIAHFNNSADLEDSTFKVGSPMYYFGGLTEAWVRDVLKGEVLVGSSRAVLLPAGGSAGIVQPNPNTMAKDGMEHKERQMKALGAKLVEDKSVQRTATEAGMEEASETSVLTSAANNVSAGYTTGLRLAAQFVGESNVSDDSLAYQLNTDLEISRMNAQDRQQLIAEWQSGGMSWHEYRWNMRRAGLVYDDDDKVRDEVAADIGSNDADLEDDE
jgi:hypothetical protein